MESPTPRTETGPVFLEVYEGRLRVIVTPDINEENNRRIIDLEGARESLRTPLEQ